MPVFYQFRREHGGDLRRVIAFWVSPCKGVIETLRRNLGEIAINLRDTRETSRLDGCNRSRSETTERLPNHVASVRDRAEDAVHELERLLVQVGGRQAAWVIDAGRCTSHRAFDPLNAMQGRQLPDVGHSVRVPPLMPQRIPLLGRDRTLPIERVVRPARLRATLVRIGGQALHHLARRPVPEPVLRKVLAGCGVPNAACFVGLGKREPGSPPLVAQPLLYRRQSVGAVDLEAPLVENADLVHNREAAYRFAVDVARDMGDSLVPGDGLDVLPATLSKKWVNRRPTDFSVPEP